MSIRIATLAASFAVLLIGFNQQARTADPKPSSEKSRKAKEILQKQYYYSIEEKDGICTVELQYVKDIDVAVKAVLDLDRVDHLKLGQRETDAHLTTLAPKLPGLLSFEIVANEHVSDAGLVHIKSMTGLRKLSLRCDEKTLTKNVVSYIEGLKSLEIVEFSHIALTGGTKPLASLTKLKELELLSCELTDADAANLAGLTALQKLDLSYNPALTDDGVRHLTKCVHLEDLQLPGTAVGNSGLKAVAPMVKLFNLDLSRTNVTDDGLVHLAGLTRMKWLNLRYAKAKGPGLKHLAGLKELELIQLDHLPGFTGEGLQHLAGCPKLKLLNLTWTEVNDDGLANVKKLQQLATLSLPYEHTDGITDKGLKHVGETPNIEDLSLNGDGITDEGVAYLAGCKKLKKLQLGVTPNIKGPGIGALKALPDLEFINLFRTGVTDDDLKHLTGLKRLDFICLPKTATAKAVKHVKEMKQLKKILCPKGVDPKAIAELKAAFPDADILEGVD